MRVCPHRTMLRFFAVSASTESQSASSHVYSLKTRAVIGRNLEKPRPPPSLVWKHVSNVMGTKKANKSECCSVWAEELLLSRETLRMINGRLRSKDNLKDLQTGRSGKTYSKLYIVADIKAETTYSYDSSDADTCALTLLLSIQQVVCTNILHFASHSHLSDENQESWSEVYHKACSREV